MVNAKLHPSYFEQDELMLILQGSINTYNFFENHTIILVHVSLYLDSRNSRKQSVDCSTTTQECRPLQAL